MYISYMHNYPIEAEVIDLSRSSFSGSSLVHELGTVDP